MRTKLLSLCVWLVVVVHLQPASAQSGQYFRITGPSPTSIISFHPDGTLVWSNALTGTNYTIQTAITPADGNSWVDYLQIPVTQTVNSNQIIDFNPPTGMVLIPAGVFTMGDVADTNSMGNAAPTNVMVSAFYMDRYDVTGARWNQVYIWATNHG